MYQFPIGVMLESFRLPTPEAVKKAAEVGAKGIQMYSTNGEHAPENMTPAKCAELLDMLKSYGLRFSALCGDLGHGFGNAEKNPQLIEDSKRILELAKELETDIVTTHIGVVPADPNHERYKIMQDACGELAAYADSMKAHFAIETGPETSLTLKGFLDTLHSTGVAVNLDPANLIVYGKANPIDALDVFGAYVRGVHAKDGLYPTNGKELGNEVKVGDGKANFPALLKGLKEHGFDGSLTIEREITGEQQTKDIIETRDYLNNLIASL